MNMGNYAHGNQPIQHMTYLYDWAGEPWKTQDWVRQVLDRMYSPWADGYCGDEDNGQTSAWYVFSALGFYPVCPAADQYAIGAPLFKKAVVTLENGKKIEIAAPANSRENFYVDGVSMGGPGWTKNYFTHSDLVKGARLRFDMTDRPNTRRGTDPADYPYSFSNE
jgi:predicted alpha-1,2-mannosidase